MKNFQPLVLVSSTLSVFRPSLAMASQPPWYSSTLPAHANETSLRSEDETIERTNCEIWAYDYSVTNFGKQLSYEHRARAHFTQAGISGVTNSTSFPPFYTIQDLMKMNGHDYM
jgi:hypothetical protein